MGMLATAYRRRDQRRLGPGSLPQLALRFWSYVSVSDGCWLWTGFRNPLGYGRLGVRGRLELAHRVAWTLQRGPIPDGMGVLHRCDNPPCVRVAHLFLGTDADNNADKVRKCRQARGETAGKAILTRPQVDEIRRRYGTRHGKGRPGSGGVTHRQLAEEYGVTLGAIEQVMLGRTWK